MEVELFNNVHSEEDTVEVDVENDNLGAEGERCGICMDVVIDRGVLDCCQHWFCFVCIDNWATITNLCPLCQNEFQLITCVPVFDTIGSNKNDEDSDSRDDDWCVEEKDNTLSFPSYYIDENAVTCLDGDGCKIRSGSVSYEETLALDTSIACDSCDTWYHAFCVGFDPEGTGVDSWLCSRCLANEGDQKSDLKEIYTTGNNADHHLVDTSSGKVSICVADTGETAVVVSRIDGQDAVSVPIMNCLPNRQLTDHHETEKSMLGPDCCSYEMTKQLDQGVNTVQLGSMVPSAKFGEIVIKTEPDDSDSRMSLELGPSFAPTLSDDKASNLSGHDECLLGTSTDQSLQDVKADIPPRLGEKRKRPGYSLQMDDDNGHHEGIRLAAGSSAKKVKVQRRTRSTLNDQADACTPEDSQKKSKLIESSIQRRTRSTLNDQVDVCTPEDSQKKGKLIESSADEINGNLRVKKNKPIDIMSIVQGADFRTVNRHARQKDAGNGAKGEKSAAGLRVKKIMRRPCVDKESDAVVQKLRKEIREAVRNKPSGDIGKSIFDPNLLAAFRAAVAGSVAEPPKKGSHAMVKAKKLMLQKGKARENLTKKIYATSSGKRRRAWDRDCEIEFWKHRCLRTSKPEKIETLRSVLKLLRKSPETKIVEQSNEEAQAPILSRLYLADASLFPRRDDIKPLSFLKAAAASNQNQALSSGGKSIESCPDNCAVKSSDRNEDPAQSNIASVDDNKKSNCISSKNGVVSGRRFPGGHPDKASPQKKMTGKTDDVKIDKRKWALEVLARKTASDVTSSMQQKQDNAALKGNYPLLAELPTDMSPKLESTRHNKIPISVRQAQLYRLTEHFLKMTNLSSMHRTAATELAVADAINIEKQVADRSNSKAVYLNLCSQEIRNHTNSSVSGTVAETTPSSSVPVEVPSKDGLEHTSSSSVPVPCTGDQSSTLSLNSEAEEALRAAGLLSDSPPNSPLHKADYLNGNDDPLGEVIEEENKSIFEMDCHPDLDIYGDFEYNLDEEDYIGATAINASKALAQEGESKVKVVFSTLSLDNGLEAKKPDLPTPGFLGCSNVAGGESSTREDKVESVSLTGDSSTREDKVEFVSLAGDSSIREDKVEAVPLTGDSSTREDKVDSVPPPGDTSLDGEGEELSVAECEELYGPDEEPLTQKFSDLVPVDTSAFQSASNHDSSHSDAKKVATDSVGSIIVGENSYSSETKQKAEEEKKSDLKIDKKSEQAESVVKKVEAYIKEHIRPLCKSGVITVEQYRWTVKKTTEKVMNYHSKAKNANFLIKEGEKVKKLAEKYVETAKHKENK